MICLLILVYLTDCLGQETMPVYYPYSWSNSRIAFGFPLSFNKMDLSLFPYWKTYPPNSKAWEYLHNAHYEVPRYIKDGLWIPASFKRHCVADSVILAFENMIYEFIYEDSTKETSESIKQRFSVNGGYYDDGFFTVLQFLMNLCRCLNQFSVDLHCPSPCFRPRICKDDQHSTGACFKMPRKEVNLEVHHKLRQRLAGVYNFDYECICKGGYVFNHKTKRCEKLPGFGMEVKCKNGGWYAMGYGQVCQCPPAFKGDLCQNEYNPCKDSRELCGEHHCFREPRNRLKGYSCACPVGMRSGGHANPRCININECKEGTNPCLNGGRCVDQHPKPLSKVFTMGEPIGYSCSCINGFTGFHCERHPPRLYWSAWSVWSECTPNCGIGTHTRLRVCPIEGRCFGSSFQAGSCAGAVSYCTAEDEEPLPENSGMGSLITQSWGIGWSIDNDRSLSDAFYWSEQEDNWHTSPGTNQTTQFADLFNWLRLTSLSHTWSLHQLLVFHAIVLAIVLLPFLVLLLAAFRKMKLWLNIRHN